MAPILGRAGDLRQTGEQLDNARGPLADASGPRFR